MNVYYEFWYCWGRSATPNNQTYRNKLTRRFQVPSISTRVTFVMKSNMKVHRHFIFKSRLVFFFIDRLDQFKLLTWIINDRIIWWFTHIGFDRLVKIGLFSLIIQMKVDRSLHRHYPEKFIGTVCDGASVRICL